MKKKTIYLTVKITPSQAELIRATMEGQADVSQDAGIRRDSRTIEKKMEKIMNKTGTAPWSQQQEQK